MKIEAIIAQVNKKNKVIFIPSDIHKMSRFTFVQIHLYKKRYLEIYYSYGENYQIFRIKSKHKFRFKYNRENIINRFEDLVTVKYENGETIDLIDFIKLVYMNYTYKVGDELDYKEYRLGEENPNISIWVKQSKEVTVWVE